MLKLKSICALGLLGTLGLFSCGGEPVVDVYVAGMYYADQTSPLSVAAVWKNGVKTDLAATGAVISIATGVYVSGENVYVSGYYADADTGKMVATVWKDGVNTVLSSTAGQDAYANAVFVNNDSVYVAGNYFDGSHFIGAVWKDGVKTDYAVADHEVQLRSIYVSGEDVYVAGKYRDPDYSDNIAAVWKNGVKTDLVVSGALHSWANSVSVSDGIVYVAGYHSDGTNDFPIVWKDGVGTDLTGVSVVSHASEPVPSYSQNAITVAGANVYVGGYYNDGTQDIPAVWKDGVKTDLPTGNTSDAYAFSVATGNGSVYACGYYPEGSSVIAAVWKDGVKTNLTTATEADFAWASSVFVNVQ